MPSAQALYLRWIRYRLDFAALVCDCVRAFWRPGRGLLRLTALGFAVLLLLPPVLVVIFGENAFGDPTAFAIALLATPIVLEVPARDSRRRQLLGANVGPTDFDRFLYLVVSGVGVAAPVLLFAIDEPSPVFNGIFWGVAIAAAQDWARTMVALALAVGDGLSVYH